MHVPSQTGCNEDTDHIVTGNVIPLLHEIRHAVQALLEDGQAAVIDLRGIPLGPGEEAHIEARLGRGEVQVQLNALGPSELVETRFPGVWLVTHYNSDGEVIGKFVEICFVPNLATAQRADIRAGLAALCAELD